MYVHVCMDVCAHVRMCMCTCIHTSLTPLSIFLATAFLGFFLKCLIPSFALTTGSCNYNISKGLYTLLLFSVGFRMAIRN